MALVAAAALFVSACGGNSEDEGNEPSAPANTTETKEPAPTRTETDEDQLRAGLPKIEQQIVTSAKGEDRQLGYKPANYAYAADCIPKPPSEAVCGLTLTDNASGEEVNTASYKVVVDLQTGKFQHEPTTDRELRPPP